MKNPITRFKDDSDKVDLGNKLITKDYLMSVYPSIANQFITPEFWIWGAGADGRLGTNDTTDRLTPVTTFAGGANWKQISKGFEHTSAIKTDGTLWIWGRGSGGQLGVNDTTDRNTPVTTFIGENNWKQVSSNGYLFSSAIKTDGTLWVWGDGVDGRLGNNSSSVSLTPVTTFSGGNDWKQVSSTRNQSAAIKTNGTLWTWGANEFGQLGTNDTTNKNSPVTTFVGGTDWKQVSVGGFHIAAIKTDGTLWTWGIGASGRLGTNDTIDRSTPVTTFIGGTNWKQVSGGGFHTTAIKTDGTLWTWGSGLNSQLGTNNTTTRSTPVTTFVGGTNWKQVSGGDIHTAAIKTDGTLWTWGDGGNGRLGNNDTTQRNTPVTTFAGGTNWKSVSAGRNYTVAIKSANTI